jgi:polyisoprenoid-binding protein YceI
MMRFSLLSTVALATLAIVPAAAQQTGPTKDPAKVEAGSYAVEPHHTRIMFGVDHMGFSTYFGEFTDASGTLDLNTKAPTTSAVDVKIATKSVSTTNSKLDGELVSSDWFDAEKFPTIEFKSSKITRTGKETAKITGDLTLHGVTKPVTLDATFHGAGMNPLSKKYTVGFDATGTFKRSDWDVKKYLPMIGDDVGLTISAAFEKQG